MDISIRGIDRDVVLRARVTRRVAALVETLRVAPVTTRVTFFDDNGPKGGVAIRCAVMARVPHRPAIRVEETASTPRLAFDRAIKTFDRQLERYRERDRDSRRHPKKYFAARRMRESGLVSLLLLATLFPVYAAAQTAAEKGGQVFVAQGCYGCHTVEKFGTPIAPDLSRIGAKKTTAELEAWLRQSPGQKPAHMPKISLTDAEVKELAAYLGSLR